MSQAFISYHRAQSKLARLIAHRIAAEGHSVWWDRGERPGDNWSEAVSTALANSACVIVIWSKQALGAPVLLGEATAGFGRGALINITTDGTAAPAPFNRAPTVDLSDWTGDAADLAWIRMREPLRARLEKPEARVEAPAAAQPALGRTLQPSVASGEPPPPGIAPPPPLRLDSSQLLPPRPAAPAYRPPVYDPPTPPPYRERRGGLAMSALVVLILGGLGAAGWRQQDAIRAALADWLPGDREAASPEASRPGDADFSAPSMAAPSAIAPIPPASNPAMAEASPPAAATSQQSGPQQSGLQQPGGQQPGARAAVAQTGAPGSATAKPGIADAPRMTYDWRENRAPPPAVRPAARPLEPVQHREEPAALTPATAPETPPAPALAAGIVLRQGVPVDLDAGRGKRAPDIFFGPDRTNSGLYLGVMNGARARSIPLNRASVRACSTGVMRRTPISDRELLRDGAVCVRSGDGAISAWRVERIVRDRGRIALTLRPAAD